MRIDAQHPLNLRLVDYFRSQAPYARPVTPKTDFDDPYHHAGAHPDVVGYLWDRIAARWPDDSRCLLFGVPVLVQPVSGIVLAVAMGTAYFVRVPEDELAVARAKGYQTIWKVSPSAIDAGKIFGGDWVLGRHEQHESRWCNTLFERFNTPAGGRLILTPDTAPKTRHKKGTLLLTVSDGPDLAPREIATNPDAAAVERCIRSLSWKGMTFVTLERDLDALTASGSLDPDDGLSMQCIEHDEERISARAPDIDKIVSIMRAYASGDDSWRTLIAWE